VTEGAEEVRRTWWRIICLREAHTHTESVMEQIYKLAFTEGVHHVRPP